ncbi:MAG: response regulator transcription factor [Candidatus Rariloculaceae bacterium]
MHALLIEDDTIVADFLKNRLSRDGHQVTYATNGQDGLKLVATKNPEVIILDRMLPGIDGLELLRLIRKKGSTTPVLILSALGEVDDKVMGLKAGGDDYLVKPFAYSELIARLESLHRRSASEENITSLKIADLELHLLSREVYRRDKKINLKPREFKLLECFARRPNQVLTRSMLLETVWDYHFDPQTNIIDVHVSRLRKKIDLDSKKQLIHTVRGEGYVLKIP